VDLFEGSHVMLDVEEVVRIDVIDDFIKKVGLSKLALKGL
jgi:hypothetical protein